MSAFFGVCSFNRRSVRNLAFGSTEKERQGALCFRAIFMCGHGRGFVWGRMGIKLVSGISILKKKARKGTICLSTVIKLKRITEKL